MRLLLALCLLSACEPSPRVATGLAIWAETLPVAELPDKVAFAAANQLAVNVSMQEGTHDRAYMRALCENAERHDVAVRFWPLLQKSDGYWANQENAEHYLAWVDTLFTWATELCPRLEGVVVDMEMPIDRVEILKEMRAAGKNELDIALFLRDGVDDGAFNAATARFAAAERAHARNKAFFVSTLPMLVSDSKDGDDALARALWTPIDGIAWDTVSFQVYRSLFDTQFTSPHGAYTPGLVTAFAQSILENYGDRGAIDLGSTGTGIDLPQGLADANELSRDISAALAAGIPAKRIAIYSLEGLDGKTDAADWVSIPAPETAPITENDSFVSNVFALFDKLD